MKNINAVVISGKEVLPLIEGGKGVAVSNGVSSGSWAAAGGVGTFSGVPRAAISLALSITTLSAK